ncbi:MAG TPA: phosphatase PAP2 family protein [Pseudorhodoplanes sp.]|jgi:membrane-associated PAP2 superfamily phosphatase|nr:phosphatase PAP2 family protein [Pseudorhodoplanes sp.]
MSRNGLLIALALAVLVGGLFAAHPELDLKISAYFVRTDFRSDHTFGLRFHPQVWALRDAIISVTAVMVLAAAAAPAWKALRPATRMAIPGRAVILLLSTLALGPGLLTNVVLKDHWARPRPVDVIEFGGSERFMPWWKPGGDCARNCSFVSGDAAGAYWTLAAAAVVPGPWRPLAFAAALTFGAAMSLLRIMAGAHFASDVFFSGLFTFLIVWIVYALLYRWPATCTTDEAIERLVVRLAARVRARLPGLRRRLRPRPGATREGAQRALDFG